MDVIKEVVLEKRETGKDIILLTGHSLSEKEMNRLTTGMIEPGTNVWLKFRGRRIGVKITKAAGYEFVGRISFIDPPNIISGGLSLDEFIRFREENIFSCDSPRKDGKSQKSGRASSKG